MGPGRRPVFFFLGGEKKKEEEEWGQEEERTSYFCPSRCFSRRWKLKPLSVSGRRRFCRASTRGAEERCTRTHLSRQEIFHFCLHARSRATEREKSFFFFPWSSRWGEMERGGERQSLLHNSSFVQYAPFSLFHLSSFALNHSPRPRPSSDGSSPAHFSQGRAFSLSIPNEALLLLLLCLRLCLCLRPCFVFDRSSDNTDDDALLCSFLQPPRSPRPAPPQSLRRLQSNRSDVCSDHQPAA